MVVEEQEMLVGSDLEEACSQQRSRLEIEGGRLLLSKPFVDNSVHAAPVEAIRSERQRKRGVDDLLHRVPVETERRPQDGMSLDQTGEGLLEGRSIEDPTQMPQRDEVVRSQAGFQLMQKPEAGLGE